MKRTPERPTSPKNRFVDAGQKRRSSNLAVQFFLQVKENKKWWLLPLFLAMLGLAALIALGSSGISPFIYTLF